VYTLRTKRMLPFAGGGLAIAAAAAAIGLTGASAGSSTPVTPSSTPIKHVVVIFDENESFDHYFGTYPNAANVAGEPAFQAKAGTPTVNGLNQTLLTANPNSANPQRLDRSQAWTCSQNHAYNPEQLAFDGGLMDKFVENTAGGSCTDKSIVMDYYDGNTVTGLWNLAQNFALNDNSFSTGFGPSTPGALNLISGNTHGATPANIANNTSNGTVIADPDPSKATNDDCASGTTTMASRNTSDASDRSVHNVGDLLNDHHVTWGWFQGGFKPTSVVNGVAVCGATHVNVGGSTVSDYSAHHNPFAYYASTANPHHLPPSSVANIGHTDQANHEYDLTDFDAALEAGNLPQVSFLKAAAFEDAHPSNSDPLDEQHFVARTIDALEKSPDWASTAVVIAYDDSDGWYDHVQSPILNPSADAAYDALNGPGKCGNVKDATAYQSRCGYGPRQPLLVISPYAKQNFVDNTLTDQTSVLKFIEDNWQLGRIGDQSMDAKAGSLGNMFNFDPNAKPAPKVWLDPSTGEVLNRAPDTTVNPDGTTSNYTAPSGGNNLDNNSGDGGTTTDTGTKQVSGTSATLDGGNTAAVSAPVVTTAPVSGKSAPAPSAKSLAVSLTCKTTGKGKAATVACNAKGAGVSKITALRFRVLKKSTVIATVATKLHGGKATAKLHFKHAVKKGTYVLRVTITQAGVLKAVTTKVHLG
jgi:phospholipase C